jgi:3-dehydroquinate dehydratase type I
LVTIITDPTPDECIATMRNAAYDGTDGYGFMLDLLDQEFHTRHDFERMFAYAADRPILVMNYRNGARAPRRTDEELIDSLLLAVEAGATMVDVVADIFDPSPLELSKRPEIVRRQQALVDRIHSMGGEVLMSSHTWQFMNAEETLGHFRHLEERGPDMVKIAMCARTEDEFLETMRATVAARRSLRSPFVHVCMGQYGKLHRVVSATLGSALVLCVQRYTATGHREQPLLRATRAVLDNLDYGLARDERLGTVPGAHREV